MEYGNALAEGYGTFGIVPQYGILRGGRRGGEGRTRGGTMICLAGAYEPKTRHTSSTPEPGTVSTLGGLEGVGTKQFRRGSTAAV